MKFMVCPQCGIANFYVVNEKGDRLNIKVTRELEIVSADESKNLEGYNLDILYCLGCSWSGRIQELRKYLMN